MNRPRTASVISSPASRGKIKAPDAYRFSVPAIGALHEIEFKGKVTFLRSENGSGKLTLLEAIALGWGLNPGGGSRIPVLTRAAHSSALDLSLIANCETEH